jgi:hypothetical protein
MNQNVPLLFLSISVGLFAQETKPNLHVETRRCCRRSFDVKSILENVRTIENRSPAKHFYIRSLPIIPFNSEELIASSTHPSAQRCINLFEAERRKVQASYLSSNVGRALYVWNGAKAKGKLTLLEGRNPFYSKTKSLLAVNITPPFKGVANISFLMLKTMDIADLEKELLEFVDSLDLQDVTAFVREDPWHWLDLCGQIDAQTWAVVAKIALESEVADTQLRCRVNSVSRTVKCSEMKSTIR